MIHSGLNLAKHVHRILHDFNFHTKLFCITTDSASNNVKMMKELTKLLRKDGVTWSGLAHHIRCLAHVINLAVKAFLSNLKATPMSEEQQWLSSDDPQELDGGQESDIEEDEDMYGNDQENIDEDADAPSLVIKEGEGFETVLLKIREISKAATVTPKRIQSFENVCTAANIKPLRLIRDHAIRWNATFNMLERALYLRKAIDLWTRSNPLFTQLEMTPRQWDMVEFLVHFLYPFMVASTTIQATARPSLPDTWAVYEELFDVLDNAKAALEEMESLPEWLKETKTAIESMWVKLRTYYDKTNKPYAYVDATLLHPGLKKRFMKKAGYGEDTILKFIREAEARFSKNYDPPNPARRFATGRKPTQRGKRPRPSTPSDSDSSDGMEYNEFSSYMQIKRDGNVNDPVTWWKGSQALYPKLSGMARDVLAVPATGAGVEREFSVSGRVVTKQRNRLAPKTIRDLMQYKRWVVQHGVVIPEEERLGGRSEPEDEDIPYGTEEEFFSDDEEDESNKSVADWLKEWAKRETVSEKLKRISK